MFFDALPLRDEPESVRHMSALSSSSNFSIACNATASIRYGSVSLGVRDLYLAVGRGLQLTPCCCGKKLMSFAGSVLDLANELSSPTPSHNSYTESGKASSHSDGNSSSHTSSFAAPFAQAVRILNSLSFRLCALGRRLLSACTAQNPPPPLPMLAVLVTQSVVATHGMV